MISYELTKAIQAERERQIEQSLRRSLFEPLDRPAARGRRASDSAAMPAPAARPGSLATDSSGRL